MWDCLTVTCHHDPRPHEVNTAGFLLLERAGEWAGRRGRHSIETGGRHSIERLKTDVISGSLLINLGACAALQEHKISWFPRSVNAF